MVPPTNYVGTPFLIAYAIPITYGVVLLVLILPLRMAGLRGPIVLFVTQCVVTFWTLVWGGVTELTLIWLVFSHAIGFLHRKANFQSLNIFMERSLHFLDSSLSDPLLM